MRQNKSKDILDYFVKHSTDSLSLEKLSDRYGVSERQIKNYIRQINQVTAPAELIVPVGNNEFCLCNEYEIYLHFFEPIEYLPKERVSFIISKLLLADSPLDLFDLANELYISRPTLESDLTSVRRTISSFQLSLSIKNDAIFLEGNEKFKRKLNSYMITNDKYTDFIGNSKLKYLNDSYRTDFIKENIIEIFNDCHFVFNDYSLNNIILHLIITIDRLHRNYELTDVLPANISTDIVTKASRKIADFLKENFDIHFSNTEFQNLLVFLSCNLSTIDYSIINSQNREVYIPFEYKALTEMIITKIKEYYYLDDFDDVFITRFMFHINNLFNRIENNYTVHNPLAAEIKSTYPLIYDIAVFVADIIRENTGHAINQDEISFIALHIGSFLENNQQKKNKLSAIYIYINYHGFYHYNIEKLQKQFHDTLDIKYSASLNDYLTSNLRADIIISECKLPKEDSLVVSPFITEAEISIIHQKIDSTIQQRKFTQFQEHFTHMFHEELFFTNITGKDEFEVIPEILNRIKPFNYFLPDFPKEVIKREELSSTCFHNGIAIPHAISQQVTKSFISFTCYHKGQPWGNENVKLVIIIGISYHERKIFRDVFRQLTDILTETSNVVRLSRAETYLELIDTIRDMILS